MDVQLDFTWKYNPVVRNPSPTKPIKDERCKLSQRLELHQADIPAISSDSDMPITFTTGGKKIVQNPSAHSSDPNRHFLNKPNIVLSKNSQRTPKAKKNKNNPLKKPKSNNKLCNPGLFEQVINKNLPQEIQNALDISKKPSFEQEPKSLSEKKSKINPSKSKNLIENLDIKFIADQEAIVKNLEKQLEREKLARKKLDNQFSQKIKEIEKVTKKIKPSEQISIKSTSKATLESNHIYHNLPVSKKLNPDSKIEPLNELPIHNLGAMVLKANKEKPKLSLTVTAQIQNLPKNTSQKKTVHSEPGHSETKPDSIHKPQFFSYNVPESDPVLNSLTAAMIRYKSINSHSVQSSSGLISQVGAKYLKFYANELTDMLIDDFLEDTVYDLQKIEEKKKFFVGFESTAEAETHFQNIVKQFEEEARNIRDKHLEVEKKDLVIERIFKKDDDEEIVIEDKRREWNLQIEERVIAGIRKYRKEFEEFQKVFAGGSDGKLWKVYAVIGDEIVDEVFDEVVNEYEASLSEFTDRFVNSEFA